MGKDVFWHSRLVPATNVTKLAAAVVVVVVV